MSVTMEFKNMMNRAWNAIDGALLGEIADASRSVLQASMRAYVYDYEPTEWARRKRRGDLGGLADMRLMPATVLDRSTTGHTIHELQIESIAGLQGLGDNFCSGADYDWGPNDAFEKNAERWRANNTRLDEIVETGNEVFHQPYPRPFYREAEKVIAETGMVSRGLMKALIAAGFEII